MEEIWKSIEECPGYFVSNYGNIKSYRTKKEVILKPRLIGPKENNKYLDIEYNSTKNGKKHYKVHRLVAKYFIPNINNLPVVNHKDRNPLNNCVTNLEWVSHQENVCHGTKKLNKTSVYTGVSWDKQQSKWKAQININGRNKNLGRFATELDAYNKKVSYENSLGIVNKYN
jgi:hypothetical protein